MFDLEIINAQIVTSTQNYQGCLSVENGKIAAISERPLRQARQTIDAAGLTLVPGMIDQHVHFMDPGSAEREDFIHGSSAAAVAGVTAVVEHTHSRPVRSIESFDDKVAYLANRSLVDYGLAAHIFPGDAGKLKSLWEQGAAVFKVFTCDSHGVPAMLNDELFQALSEIASFDGNVLIHCEDDNITAGNEQRLRAAQRSDNGVIPEWRSIVAEQVAVNTVTFMARLTGARVTVAHNSHKLALDLIARDRALGAKLYAEICPQYLFLNEDMVREKGPFAKFTPPARPSADAKGMVEFMQNGSFQILSSDHAPSTAEQKRKGSIWECHFGLPGIDTTFPMMLKLVSEGTFSLQRVVELYSENPAKVLGLYPRKGCIAVGADADIVLVDMHKQWTIKNETILSKAGWTPFEGTTVTGKAQMTFVRGQLVADNGKIVADPGAGKLFAR